MTISRSLSGKENSVNVLALHGAGDSNKNKFYYLIKPFKERQINIHTFDFFGFGQSAVKITKSSLKIRQEQVESVIKDLQLKEPLNIIGSSMGGYNAVKLLEKYSVANLFLFCPGFYTPEAFDVKFGNNFTNIIRKNNSWINSDAFKLLEKYTGNLFVCIGEEDEVIPKALIEKIAEVAKKTKKIQIYTVAKANHKIHDFLEKNSKECQYVIDIFEDFLKG
jgi:uncharacterized protein